jgi:osmotically-inducible protein OsmY
VINLGQRFGAVVVETVDDKVILKGEVCSYYLKQLAQEIVKRHCGGVRIENNLRVSDEQTRISKYNGPSDPLTFQTE